MSPSTPATTPTLDSPACALLKAVTFSIPDWEYRYVGIADHIRACLDVTPPTSCCRLPRHEQMADFYGVSTVTVRRAMKNLGATGTVEITTRGTYIITTEEHPTPAQPHDRTNTPASANLSRPHLVTSTTG